MTKKVTIACGMAFMLALLFVGLSCTDKQSGIILTDTTGDGRVDSRGIDKDRDGNIDVDAAGNPVILPGLGPYKYTPLVDESTPMILTTAGVLTGLSVLGIIGAWWKQAKPARMLANLITAIQVSRQELKDSGPKGALTIFDRVLKETQDPELRAWVIKAKETMDLVSVTNKDDA